MRRKYIFVLLQAAYNLYTVMYRLIFYMRFLIEKFADNVAVRSLLCGLNILNNNKRIFTLIYESEKFELNALEELIVKQNFGALVIRNFLEEELVEKLRNYISTQRHEVYLHDVEDGDDVKTGHYGVNRIGMPFNLTFNDSGEEIFEEYHQQALAHFQELEQVCAPHSTPMQQVIDKIGDEWEQGIEVGMRNGKTMSSSIFRITLPNNKDVETPHCDSLPADKTFIESSNGFEAQFGLNIYIDVPNSGGELLVWDMPALTLEEASQNNNKLPNAENFPEPKSVSPNSGDLIIVNTRKPHAISSFDGKERTAISCFIGFSAGLPLQIWS